MKKVHFKAFLSDEDGSATVMSLYMVLIGAVMTGLAIDFQKRHADKTHLQIAADSVAHGALYSRETSAAGQAKSDALALLDKMLPRTNMGPAITTADITFGTWDVENETFLANEGSRDAVRVYAGMTEYRGNPTPNLILSAIGFKTFDVAAESIYSTYFPPCFLEGFVAEDVVDVQSNNFYGSGFCMHSNTYVSLNSNNTFEAGSIVSMPNLDDLDIPKSGFDKNAGLSTALRSGSYRIRILDKIDDIVNGLRLGNSDYLPSGIYSIVGNSVSGNKIEPADMEAGRLYTQSCGGGGKLTFESGTYSNIVHISNCEVKFSQGVIIQDSVIVTTSTSSRSFNSPSGFQLGANDNCAAGGGAALITYGGVSVASDLKVFGGQIIAQGDIDFAANANGMEGVSFVAGGSIDSTSNMSMGYCDGEGMEAAFQADYFRMVH
ncbi:Tad domain-containing protein [Tateyamaria sp.]|uniref:Tad domain-containing protein n=1 Tax=Tateyamaria sp. TaxID=1929288 RepID=UPI00329EE2A4